MRNSRAFTLIELLVVVAIISLLASVLMSSLQSARSKARDSKRVQDMRQMENAIELYKSYNGSYPIANCISSPWWNCWGSAGETRLISSTFIATMQQDPSFADNGAACSFPTDNSRLYAYYSDNGQRYVLVTNLENPIATADIHHYGQSNYVGGCTNFGNWYIDNGF